MLIEMQLQNQNKTTFSLVQDTHPAERAYNREGGGGGL